MNDPVSPGEHQETKRNPDGTFPKGVSGNYAGQPKGTKQLTTKLREALNTIFEFKDKNTGEIIRERADVLLAKRLLQKAVVDLDPALLKLVMNYSEGLPPQSLDLTTGGDKITKVEVEIVHAKAQDPGDERPGEKPPSE